MATKNNLPSSITDNIQCVVSIGERLDEIRKSVEQSLLSTEVRDRGYFLPAEEDEALAIWGSYQHARSVLLEVIDSLRAEKTDVREIGLSEFLVGYSAATLLVEAARFLRHFLSDEPAIRSKLNEAQPQLQIEEGSFEAIQLSLTSPSNAVRIRQARDFFDEHEGSFKEHVDRNPILVPILNLIQSRREILEVSTKNYVKSRLHDRRHQITDGVLQKAIVNAIYGIQQLGAVAIGSLSTSPSHHPKLPDSIAQKMKEIILRGDILVTRKEKALTNYFLPGFWPHAAFSIGDNTVVEALKDGVKQRTLESTFENDAMIILRPQVSEKTIDSAVARAVSHAGKPYDFDFDFTRSDRLVCTEVIYRSYSGLEEIHFELTKRAGRYTLSAEDLLQLAIQGSLLQIVAAYHPDATEDVLMSEKAKELVEQSIGKKRVEWNAIG